MHVNVYIRGGYKQVGCRKKGLKTGSWEKRPKKRGMWDLKNQADWKKGQTNQGCGISLLLITPRPPYNKNDGIQEMLFKLY